MSTPLTAIRVEFFPDEYPGWQLFSGWMRRPSPIAGGADCREPSPSYPHHIPMRADPSRNEAVVIAGTRAG